MKLIIGVFIVTIGILALLKKRKFEKTKTYKWETEKKKFEKDFTEIVSKNPNLEYLIIEFDSYYIQYKGFIETKEFYAEIVSNEFLNENKKYSEIKIEEILNLEFSKPNEKDNEGNVSPNYSKWYKSETKNEIEFMHKELIRILKSIFKMKNGTEIKVRY
ncbi:hypothetical protein SCB49_01307 [unidentified eubacterium SCB49]|nr:hypothetical protein SCB49_01307 [unidentified eubacterium SCB49]